MSGEVFLFLIGAIKKALRLVLCQGYRPFQFQTGAIRRLCENSRYIVSNPYSFWQVNFGSWFLADLDTVNFCFL